MKEELPYEEELIKQEKRKELKGVLIDLFLDLGLGKEDAVIVQELFLALRFREKEPELKVITHKIQAIDYRGECPARDDTVGFRVMINKCADQYEQGKWKTAMKSLMRNYPFFTIENKQDLKQILDNYKNV